MAPRKPLFQKMGFGRPLKLFLVQNICKPRFLKSLLVPAIYVRATLVYNNCRCQQSPTHSLQTWQEQEVLWDAKENCNTGASLQLLMNTIAMRLQKQEFLIRISSENLM
ncbi:uncharacterized protein LOC122017510 [Zingiber officinale]|uniref:uncharacterized protein LOC122017510 n=1 Tax=Zingiber officinale TaxID=94328 RepID=UPI001C4BDED5|nr:uncharacterized protein LOC122017510 [Zingiber officinale]